MPCTRQFSTTKPLIPKERGGSRIERMGSIQFSTTILLISKEGVGSRIQRKDIKQFSTTKPLKPIFFYDCECNIIVNSTVNKLNFVNNQSILLLPSFMIDDNSEFLDEFLIVCSKLKKEGTYKFKFYFDVKLNREMSDLD